MELNAAPECSRITSTQLLLQLIGKSVQLGSVALSKIFRGPDSLAKHFLQDHDSTAGFAGTVPPPPRPHSVRARLDRARPPPSPISSPSNRPSSLRLHESRHFVALEFQASVVGHQLFGGSGDHFKDSGGFGEFLIGKQTANFRRRQFIGILQEVRPAFCWRRMIHSFSSHLKMIQLQKMDLQIVRQSKVCRQLLAAESRDAAQEARKTWPAKAHRC